MNIQFAVDKELNFSLWVIQAKLVAAKQKIGRDIRVFETSISSQTHNDASNSGRNHLFFLSIS